MHSSPQTDSNPPDSVAGETAVGSFIARWAKSGASERANYQLFLSELCTILGVPRPNPSTADDHENAYIFERRVSITRSLSPDSNPKSPIQNPKFSSGFIDLYKRDCFVLETKQGVERKDKAALSDAGREREANAKKGHGTRGGQIAKAEFQMSNGWRGKPKPKAKRRRLDP